MGLPGLNQYYTRINVLAQGHNAVTLLRLRPGPLGLESTFHGLIIYYLYLYYYVLLFELVCCKENNVDPDQLAS